jgi:putative ABC transport system ATP-binding protein
MNSGQAHSARGTADAGQPPQVMVAADDIRRTFGSGHTAVHAPRGVSFTVDRGQLVALRGRSGSGETTLLNVIGGLDDPTTGQVRPKPAQRSAPLAAVGGGGPITRKDLSEQHE